VRYLAIAAVFLGCSSGGAQPAQPAQPTTPDPAPAAPAVKPPPDTGGYRLVVPAQLTWSPLLPNTPGPELAVVTGDLQKGGGFFLRLPAGAKPGLHVHSSDYHAIVISGAPRHWLPGEDKKARPLGPGTYWFQPGNQPHGDECTGTEPCVLYLVVAGAFDSTPTPNARPGKPDRYFLADRKDLKFAPLDPSKPDGFKLAIVSGDPKTGPVAFVVEVPPGGNSGLHSHTSEYHALVLEGAPAHWLPHDASLGEPLAPGTYWFQPGGYDHGDRCTGSVPCRSFVMMPRALDFKPGATK
jgi:quercetin dioxygenase-like cupin family protein